MTEHRRDTEMSAAGWHVPEGDLLRYARQSLSSSHWWSTEAHLMACAFCRERLADVVDPDLVAAGWARLDAELDAPARGLVETLLVRAGIADHTARLLVCTPRFRRSWLAATVLVLALSALLEHIARHGPLFLAVTPMLPVAGVALSFGAAIDPAYEMALVAPTHGLRLLLLRTVSVLATTTPLSVLASLALPAFGFSALAWLLPSLTLTSLSLVLMPWVGPVRAAGLVGAGWTAVAVCSAVLSSGRPLPFGLPGQLTAAGVAIVVAKVITADRDRFDVARSLPSADRLVNRSM